VSGGERGFGWGEGGDHLTDARDIGVGGAEEAEEAPMRVLAQNPHTALQGPGFGERRINGCPRFGVDGEVHIIQPQEIPHSGFRGCFPVQSVGGLLEPQIFGAVPPAPDAFRASGPAENLPAGKGSV